MRQVGYLQRLYPDARSTEHKIMITMFITVIVTHFFTKTLILLKPLTYQIYNNIFPLLSLPEQKL